MPAPGRHRPVAPLVPGARRPGWRWPSTAVTGSALGAFEDGIAAPRRAPSSPVLVSVFLEGGSTRCRCSRRSATRATTHCARSSRCRRLRARLRRGLPAALASVGGRLATLHGEGKVSVLPGDRLRPSGPVPLHLPPLLGGRRDRPPPPDRLARAASSTQPVRRTIRCRACRWTASFARARDGAVPVASIDGPDRYAFWPPKASAVRARERRCSTPSPSSGPRTAGERSRAAPGGRGGGAVAPAARPAAAVHERSRRARLPYPERRRTTSRAGSRGSRRCSPPGCRCAASRSRAGEYDTHYNQADDLSDGLKLTSDSLLAFQRDLEARGLADRVLSTSGRSSGGACRRTARAAPTTAPPGSAS